MHCAFWCVFTLLKPDQNDWHFPYDILKCILLNDNFLSCFKFYLSLLLHIKSIVCQHWVQVMAWHWTGAKPLRELNDDKVLQHHVVSLGHKELIVAL